MDTLIRIEGMEGKVLAGDFIVSAMQAFEVPEWYMAERTVVGCGKGILQPVHLRPGNWEVWIDHGKNGEVRGVRMQSVYAAEQEMPHLAMLHAEEHTWQIGSQRKQQNLPGAIVEKNGTNGLAVHLLSYESLFGAVVNAKRQVEQLHFIADQIDEERIVAQYTDHFLFGDKVLDGFEMKWGFWRVALSKEGHLLFHHEDHEPQTSFRWTSMKTQHFYPLIKDVGLNLQKWAVQTTRLVGMIKDDQQQLTAILIAPHSLM